MYVVPILNRHALGHVIYLVYSYQSRRKLEHVVTKRDDNELGILRSLLDVTCYDRYLSKMLADSNALRDIESTYISEI